ncbi:cytoplasmic membrane lipoprotein-28 [Escherichia coli]|uniref:Cytoplasmic membrane lipoprotein-28 n=1 Tax=Escherichia coli TaxID=562 RepID=A0A2X3JXP5_ECOLX|nr:cytoplasmic membrane lipoprotein-28 [Escherichia coli]
MKLTTHHLRTGAALLLAGILLAGCDQSSSDANTLKLAL